MKPAWASQTPGHEALDAAAQEANCILAERSKR